MLRALDLRFFSTPDPPCDTGTILSQLPGNPFSKCGGSRRPEVQPGEWSRNAGRPHLVQGCPQSRRKVLGHEQMRTTTAPYCHVTPGLGRDAEVRIGNALWD